MIRARFFTHADDWGAKQPAKHPYWCTGYGEDGRGEFAVIVTYADNVEEVMRLWPDARDIDCEEVSEYYFSNRFPKPDWMA